MRLRLLGMTMSKKLDALHKKYGSADAGVVHDPEFKKVVDMLFSGTGRRAKPYEGVSSFLDCPLMLDAMGKKDLGGLDADHLTQAIELPSNP